MSTVLVIDDDASMREILETILMGAGYSVAVAANGREALLQYAARAPDLIITDVVMPEMDGFELIQALRRTARKVPVIVISGNPAREVYLHMAGLFGAVQTLAKPFTAEVLLNAVEQTLAAR